MIRKIKAGSILLLLAIVMQAEGQQLKRNTVSQHNAWLPVTANIILTNKWGLYAEAQYRSSGPLEEVQQYLLRGGIDYYLHESVPFTAGYGHVITYPYGEQPVSMEFREHRTWQQFALSNKTGRFAFSHRYRIEQRWIQKQEPDARDEYIYVNRMRYRIQLNVPLNRPSIEKGSVFAALADEVFLSFGKNVQYNVLDQNRLYGGIGYQLSNSLQVQAGYLNQLLIKSNGQNQENNHTWQLSVGWKLDPRKKSG